MIFAYGVLAGLALARLLDAFTDHMRKARSRRDIGEFRIWIEPRNSRGRPYADDGLTLYRVQYPASRGGRRGLALPVLVPDALRQYLVAESRKNE